MNQLTTLNDKRKLNHQENIERIIDVAKVRFDQLGNVDADSFEADTWHYRGASLLFARPEGKPTSEFVKNTVKAFLIDNLWRTRARNGTLSKPRIFGLFRTITLLHQQGVQSINELDQTLYEAVTNNLIDDKSKETLLNDFNAYIEFLQKEHALLGLITLILGSQVWTKRDEDFEALKEKMPEQDLIAAIIELKNRIEAEADGSHKSNRDLLCIYTQAFQYGLGLRIGETLRLSKDCLFEYEGKLLCRVWTEKGAEPLPRLVLGDWRELLSEVYEKVLKLTEQTRSYAIELESNGTNSYIESAFEQIHADRSAIYDTYIDRLDQFIASATTDAQQAWALKRSVNPSTEYTLDDLPHILPIASSAKNTPDKVKAYQKWDLDLTVTPIDKKKNRYTVSGQAILDFIDEQIRTRSENITRLEFLTILHGTAITTDKGQANNAELFGSTRELAGSTATCYTFDPSSFQGKGRAPAAMTVDDAKTWLRSHANNLINENEITVKQLLTYFPEIPFLQATTGKTRKERNLHLEIRTTRVGKVTESSKSNIGYSVTTGDAISLPSIKKYAMSRFFERNQAKINELNDSAIEEELLRISDSIAEETPDYQLPATTISSKSFVVEQHVSDYLFLCPMKLTGSADSITFIPEVLDYKSLLHFFKGNDRYPSAFERYGIKDAEKLKAKWQSHQGRHWRTTSLFRSGAHKSLVNKYMGRTEAQGAHYDHNTGTERAKIVRDAMKDATERFAGSLPAKVAELKRRGATEEAIDSVLEAELQTVSKTPLGECKQHLLTNPCDLYLRCLNGNGGKGCKHLVIDLDDPSTLAKIEAVRDETRHEIERLVEVRDRTNNVAIDPHLEQKITLFDNANKVVSLSKASLEQRSENLELIPFKDGDNPDDCPFQCGGD